MNSQKTILTKRDYLLISFIGVAFTLFLLPILPNVITGLTISPIIFAILILTFLILSNLALWIASLLAKRVPVILQIAKFSAIGVFNTFLDWGIVNLLIILTGIAKGIFFSVFSGAGFIVANIGSFFWNKYWTFSSKDRQKDSTGKDFAQFFFVSVIGLGIKVGIASFVVNGLGVSGNTTPEQWANIGNVAGTAFAMIWNFIGYKFWVFKK